MFRTVQKFQPASFCHVMVQEQTIENDVVVEKEVPACRQSPLPPVQLFDLETMLNAKVNLQQVSCRLPVKSFDVQSFVARTEAKNKKATQVETKGVENE